MVKDLNLGKFTSPELEKKIKRMELEHKVIDLGKNREAANRGESMVNSILKTSGPSVGKQVFEKVGISVLTGGALYLAKSMASKSFNREEFGDALFNGGPKKK